MEDRNNDTSHMDITDIINRNYKPTKTISPEIGMRIMDDLSIIDETDTIMTESFGDWGRLVSYIIDKYLSYKEPDEETGDFDLTQLDQSNNPENGVVSEFLEKLVRGIPEEGEIPRIVNLKGELPHHDRFYEMVKEYEKHKLRKKEEELTLFMKCKFQSGK